MKQSKDGQEKDYGKPGIMETSEKGNQCSDPKFLAAKQKKWGLIFYCLVLEYHKNHLLMRTVYWYWQVCKPFQGTWPSSLSINRNPHHHKVVRAVGCIIHQKAKHHLFLKNEFPYLWGKKIISGIFSLWMEP